MINAFDKHFEGPAADQKARLYLLVVYPKSRTDDPPLARLWIERQCNRVDEQASLGVASIALNYYRITATPKASAGCVGINSGSFRARYCETTNTISLTCGAVYLDLEGLEGQRVGTYLMNEIVTWSKQWPAAEIDTITLKTAFASPDNKQRRNRFYEQFGLRFDYDDAEGRSGTSQPMRAHELNTVDSWRDNIQEVDARDYACEREMRVETAEADLVDLKSTCKRLAAEQLAAEARPLYWAAKTLFRRHAFAGGAIGIVIAFGLLRLSMG